ncbi:MAG: hypothetical protein DMF66_15960 [Acidobacteria bacterium]|nr:MAG: hypothetical protein DMF66_15960 [Acidobacteriota bacterium]
MKTILFTAAGVGLLMLTAYDVYATVLHARSRYGPVGERLNRTVWRVARWVAFRLSRARRHHFLNGVGPLLLPMLIGTYIADGRGVARVLDGAEPRAGRDAGRHPGN